MAALADRKKIVRGGFFTVASDLFLCLLVCLSVCLSLCLSIRLSVCLSVCLLVCSIVFVIDVVLLLLTWYRYCCG